MQRKINNCFSLSRVISSGCMIMATLAPTYLYADQEVAGQDQGNSKEAESKNGNSDIIKIDGVVYALKVPKGLDILEGGNRHGINFSRGIYKQTSLVKSSDGENVWNIAASWAQSGDGVSVSVCNSEVKYRDGSISDYFCGLYSSGVELKEDSGVFAYRVVARDYNPGFKKSLFGLLGHVRQDSRDFYSAINNHFVQKTIEVYVPYPPDSVKSNFDRSYSLFNGKIRYKQNKAAQHQYQVYSDSDKRVVAGMTFWPNKNGTLVSVVMEGQVINAKAKEIDWTDGIQKATIDVERVAKQ